MSKQPRDDGNDPIPVLGFRQHGGKIVPFETGSANSSPAIANSIRVVTLYSTVDAFFETGDSGITANKANSHFVPAGIPYDISLGSEIVSSENDRFLSIIGNTEDGVAYISERD